MYRSWWQLRQLWESFNTWKAKGGSQECCPFHIHLCSVQVRKNRAADSWGAFIKYYHGACVFFKFVFFKSGGQLKETNTGSAAALCLYPCVHGRRPRHCWEGGTGQRCHTGGSSVTHGHTAASSQDRNSQPEFPRDGKVHTRTELLPSKVRLCQPLTWSKTSKTEFFSTLHGQVKSKGATQEGKRGGNRWEVWAPKESHSPVGALDPPWLSPRCGDAQISVFVAVSVPVRSPGRRGGSRVEFPFS